MTDSVPVSGTRFRKKPVEIDAHRWFRNGDHPEDYTRSIIDLDGTVYTPEYRRERNWEGDVVRYFRDPDIPGTWLCTRCDQLVHVHGWIGTLEGGHRVCPGDWIITGVAGERYPCKPNIFAETYEAVSQ